MSRPDYLNMKSNAQSEPTVLDADRQGNSYEVATDSGKVLRNTYLLLSMTLLFSAVTAGIAMAINMPPLGFIITIVGYFGLLFLTEKTKNSAMGIVSVFALTGFMGLTLGPILSYYVSLPGGTQTVLTALGGTGLIFFAMSGWVLSTGKELSGWGKSLMIGLIVAFVLSIANIFLGLPVLSLAVSGLFIILSSALIAYQTSAIIHGGETNYISATVTLFVSIYNIFLSLLQILGVMGSDD